MQNVGGADEHLQKLHATAVVVLFFKLGGVSIITERLSSTVPGNKAKSIGNSTEINGGGGGGGGGGPGP